MYKERILFLGIGGVSMSKLALFALSRGATVIGYDAVRSSVTDMLENSGIEIYYSPRPFFTNFDYAVYSSAIKESDPEMIKIRAIKKTCYERCDFWGYIASLHKKTVAIAGAHGKTTTTALISHILKDGGISVTSHIGGESDYSFIGDEVFVTEACEYKKSFLSLAPDVAVVLNVERDHPDCYPTDESYVSAFEEFAQRIKTGGKLVIRKDDYKKFKNLSSAVLHPKCEFNGECDGKLNFTYKGINVKSELMGKHNAENVAFAIEVARLFGVKDKSIENSIESFTGVKRRFEKVGELNGVGVISDYAHHPTELSRTIEVAKSGGKVFGIFQPHTYSRTAGFFEEFKNALKMLDGYAVYKTFAAREKPADGIDAKTLAEAIGGKYFDSERKVYNFFDEQKVLKEYDKILILGAGNLDEIVRRYFQS